MDPILVEVTGPAGAGKSVISQALSESSNSIVLAGTLRTDDPRNIPYCLSEACRLLPLLIGLAAAGSLSREDVKKLLYLRGWDRVLRRQAQAGQLVVLDQGPIFKLATLYEFGPDNLRRNDRWWQSMLDRWAQAIDWIVRLDGPNEVLIGRINSRDKSHEIKAIDEYSMCLYLDRYRRSYDHVISEIRSRGKAEILTFDTTKATPQQIVSKISEAIN